MTTEDLFIRHRRHSASKGQDKDKDYDQKESEYVHERERGQRCMSVCPTRDVLKTPTGSGSDTILVTDLSRQDIGRCII